MPAATRGPAASRWSVRTLPGALVLGLIALSFVVPKLLLVDFFRALWLTLSPTDLLRVCLQDLAVAVLVLAALDALLASARPRRFAVAALVSTALFALTLLDTRVRQVWLRPTSVELVEYGLTEGSALGSGLQLFFNLRSGWAMTFRRALVLLTGGHVLLWGVLALVARRGVSVTPVRGRRRLLAGSLVTVGLVVLAARAGGRYRYDLQDHMFTRLAVRPLRAPVARAAAAPFDQAARPAREVLRGDRLILRDSPPFQNVVIVFLESVRWRDFAGPDGPMPVLRRLAREGLVSRCYASVPHSTKGYQAALSGRYPYPGIEMRETFALAQPGLLRALHERKGLETFAFSSLSLAFENTGGLLRSLGARHLFETADLAREAGVVLGAHSSFGSEDGPLYHLAARRLAAARAPFAAVFLPSAAHYPYEYPGKPEGEGPTHAAYLRALQETDRLLGDLVARFTAAGLERDTLFVLVGDHGEAFGEHGLTAHNSSVHEEEVTVPLVLWSADGRLAQREPLAPSRQIDVAPTVLDLMGDTTAPLPVMGVSLLRTLGRPAAYLATFIDGVALGLVDPPLKYVYEPAADQLAVYDLEADPAERQPRRPTGEERARVVERLRAFMAHQGEAFPADPASARARPP